MRYLLDTNVCIRIINRRVPQLRERLLAVPTEDVAVSIITKAELFYGSAKSQTPERSREKQLEFLQTLQTIGLDEAPALKYGEIRAALERRGTPIGAFDMLIAATALTQNLTLVTHNVAEFRRIDGLLIEDWEAQP